jgi:DNA-binding NarL/FixJ family response regulator
LYREGLAAVLAADGRVEVAGASSSVDDASLAVREQRADVVVVDVGSQPLATERLRAVVEATPEARVVALAVDEAGADVDDCAAAGATGYVTREASVDEFVAALEAAGRDELRCPPEVAAMLMRRIAVLSGATRSGADAPRQLTQRQLEIARLVERGLSNKQIAQELCIELATVKNHVHTILERLEIGHRAEVGRRLRGGEPTRI